MTAVTLGMVAQLGLAVLALAAALVPSNRWRSTLVGLTCVALGLAGAATGVLALLGHTGQLTLDVPLTWAGGSGGSLTLAPSPLGGFFLLVAGLVGAAASLFGIGYAHGPVASRTGWAAVAVFMLGMQLVPAAADMLGFLLAWELMAVASSVLVLTEHNARPAVRSAGLWYAAMTHLSFLFVLAGFAVLIDVADATEFRAVAQTTIPDGAANWAFVLLTIGFGTKAGLVPMHVWLPRAHPEAPSHVSAMMSAAMVKMGVYGVILTVTTLLPTGPAWWGLLLLALALPSALYGILQASVASDLKRLLAYSTTENVGLIFAALAVALLTRASGPVGVANIALVAALMLVASHAAFKTVLFLGAGAILAATGERDLDRLGGLASRMPITAAAMAIGALGAAALPITSGFTAEWVLLQSLIHADTRTARLTTALLPAVIAVVALTAGLALLTLVKAFGIAFLARPRCPGAEQARETSATMRVALVASALIVLALGLTPGVVGSAAARALDTYAATPIGVAGIALPGIHASLDPLSLTALGLLVTLPVLLLGWRLARAVPRRRVELGWGCGGMRTSPRMQYTATSYAEPLVRVFADALAPTRDLQLTYVEEAHYLDTKATYSQHVADVVEERAYQPVVRALTWAGDRARRVQNGSIHRYLAFSFAALVIVLAGVVR